MPPADPTLPPAPPVATPDDRPRVLMLTHRLPVPPNRGDRIRSFHLLGELRQRFHVSLACTTDHDPTPDDRVALGELVHRCRAHTLSPRDSKVAGLVALLKGRPATPACFYREALAEAIVQWHRERPFDAVLTFCSGMIGYARAVFDATPSGARRPVHVLDLVDVDSAKWDAYAKAMTGGVLNPMRWVYAAEAKRLVPIEAGGAVAFDHVTVVSGREAETYRRRLGLSDKLHVVHNGVDLEAYHPPRHEPEPANRVVFVGQMDYLPNVEAVAWFAREVMPLLTARAPEAVFRIVGRSPTAAVRRLAERGRVEVTGAVDAILPELHGAAVVVAPLRIARGVQNKVLEAMAAGRAVVASPQAAEGIDALAGSELLVADAPSQWADRIATLLRDPTRREHIGHAARARMDKDRPWSAALAPMLDLLDRRTAGAHPLPRVA